MGSLYLLMPWLVVAQRRVYSLVWLERRCSLGMEQRCSLEFLLVRWR